MKRTRISEWPRVRVSVNPQTLERVSTAADLRGLSVSAVIREALDQAYKSNEAPFRLGMSPFGSDKLG